MAYDKKGHFRLPDGPSIGSGDGSVKKKHMYVTNDDAATVETAGYFDIAYEQFQTGDQMDCSLDLDGVPARIDYVVVRTGPVIALTRQVDLIV